MAQLNSLMQRANQTAEKKAPSFILSDQYMKNICQYLEKSWEDCASQPDQLPIYKMKDEDGKLMYQRKSQDISRDAVQQEPELENPQLTQEATVLCSNRANT